MITATDYGRSVGTIAEIYREALARHRVAPAPYDRLPESSQVRLRAELEPGLDGLTMREIAPRLRALIMVWGESIVTDLDLPCSGPAPDGEWLAWDAEHVLGWELGTLMVLPRREACGCDDGWVERLSCRLMHGPMGCCGGCYETVMCQDCGGTGEVVR